MFGGPKVQHPAAVIRLPTLVGATRSDPSGDTVIWVSSQLRIAPGLVAEYCMNAASLLSNPASIAASIVERGSAILHLWCFEKKLTGTLDFAASAPLGSRLPSTTSAAS